MRRLMNVEKNRTMLRWLYTPLPVPLFFCSSSQEIVLYVCRGSDIYVIAEMFDE
jgi:hypothetical protein